MEEKLYTMKQVCKQTGLSYDTLKFYCNEYKYFQIKV